MPRCCTSHQGRAKRANLELEKPEVLLLEPPKVASPLSDCARVVNSEIWQMVYPGLCQIPYHLYPSALHMQGSTFPMQHRLLPPTPPETEPPHSAPPVVPERQHHSLNSALSVSFACFFFNACLVPTSTWFHLVGQSPTSAKKKQVRPQAYTWICSAAAIVTVLSDCSISCCMITPP